MRKQDDYFKTRVVYDPVRRLRPICTSVVVPTRCDDGDRVKGNRREFRLPAVCAERLRAQLAKNTRHEAQRAWAVHRFRNGQTGSQSNSTPQTVNAHSFMVNSIGLRSKGLAAFHDELDFQLVWVATTAVGLVPPFGPSVSHRCKNVNHGGRNRTPMVDYDQGERSMPGLLSERTDIQPKEGPQEPKRPCLGVSLGPPLGVIGLRKLQSIRTSA